jgi:hypothetical protein
VGAFFLRKNNRKKKGELIIPMVSEFKTALTVETVAISGKSGFAVDRPLLQ